MQHQRLELKLLLVMGTLAHGCVITPWKTPKR